MRVKKQIDNVALAQTKRSADIAGLVHISFNVKKLNEDIVSLQKMQKLFLNETEEIGIGLINKHISNYTVDFDVKINPDPSEQYDEDTQFLHKAWSEFSKNVVEKINERIRFKEDAILKFKEELKNG